MPPSPGNGLHDWYRLRAVPVPCEHRTRRSSPSPRRSARVTPWSRRRTAATRGPPARRPRNGELRCRRGGALLAGSLRWGTRAVPSIRGGRGRRRSSPESGPSLKPKNSGWEGPASSKEVFFVINLCRTPPGYRRARPTPVYGTPEFSSSSCTVPVLAVAARAIATEGHVWLSRAQAAMRSTHPLRSGITLRARSRSRSVFHPVLREPERPPCAARASRTTPFEHRYPAHERLRRRPRALRRAFGILHHFAPSPCVGLSGNRRAGPSTPAPAAPRWSVLLRAPPAR